MLAELEAAVLKKLSDNGIENAKIFDFRNDNRTRREIHKPTVFCSIDAAEFEPWTDDTFMQEVTVSLVVIFKQLKNEEERRKGLYPVLEGIINLLLLQALDLDIEPLRPINLKNITDRDDAQRGELLYQLDLMTKYEVAAIDPDADAEDILAIGLKYYLQEPTDDGLADAEDLIT